MNPSTTSTVGSRCGTVTGWTRHQRAGERPCDACTAAKAASDRRWRSAPDSARRNRVHARAQRRAYAELARRHKAEYDNLYRQYKADIVAETTT